MSNYKQCSHMVQQEIVVKKKLLWKLIDMLSLLYLHVNEKCSYYPVWLFDIEF